MKQVTRSIHTSAVAAVPVPGVALGVVTVPAAAPGTCPVIGEPEGVVTGVLAAMPKPTASAVAVGVSVAREGFGVCRGVRLDGWPDDEGGGESTDTPAAALELPVSGLVSNRNVRNGACGEGEGVGDGALVRDNGGAEDRKHVYSSGETLLAAADVR